MRFAGVVQQRRLAFARERRKGLRAVAQRRVEKHAVPRIAPCDVARDFMTSRVQIRSPRPPARTPRRRVTGRAHGGGRSVEPQVERVKGKGVDLRQRC